MPTELAPIAPRPPWWQDIHAVLELVALLAVAAAIGASLLKGKLDPTQAVLMMTGALATITSAVNRRGGDEPNGT